MTLFENNALMTTKQNGLVENFSVNVGESDSLTVIIPSRDLFTTTQGMANPVGVRSACQIRSSPCKSLLEAWWSRLARVHKNFFQDIVPATEDLPQAVAGP